MTTSTKCISANALTLLCFVGFSFFRDIQLGQVDPYNNPYTGISTALLLGFLVSWVFARRVTLKNRKVFPPSAAVFCWIICGLGACFVAFFLLNMLAVVFG